MKKRVLSTFLVIVMMLALAPAVSVGAENTTPANAQRIEQRQTITVTLPGTSAPADARARYLAFTMPHDGVINITASRSDGTAGTVSAGFVGVPAMAAFHPVRVGRNGVVESQFSLRAGEWLIRFEGPATVLSFSYFISSAYDTSWNGTINSGSSDTAATARILAPATIATGNVGVPDLTSDDLYGGRKDFDLYRFSLSSKSEVELRARSIDGRVRAWVVDFDDPRSSVSAGSMAIANVADGWVSRNYTL